MGWLKLNDGARGGMRIFPPYAKSDSPRVDADHLRPPLPDCYDRHGELKTLDERLVGRTRLYAGVLRSLTIFQARVEQNELDYGLDIVELAHKLGVRD